MRWGYKITNVSDNRITLEHKFSTNWSKDGNNHWHECACGKEKIDEAPHSFKWEHNSDRHWKKCSICGKETDKVSHNFSEEKFAPTTDNLGGTNYTCPDCGYEY